MAGSSGGWFTIKGKKRTKGKVFLSLSAIQKGLEEKQDLRKYDAGFTVRPITIDDARAVLAELRAVYDRDGADGRVTMVFQAEYEKPTRKIGDAILEYGKHFNSLPSGAAKGKIPPDPGPQGADYSRAAAIMPRTSAENIAEYTGRLREYLQDPSLAYDYDIGDESPDAAINRAVARVREIAANSDIAMQIPAAVLAKILNSGQFLNQHASGKSGMTFNPAIRAKAEHTMFGIAQDGDPADFPIYGYLTIKGSPPSLADMHYGPVRVVFKDSLRERTTITVNDSLGSAYNYGGYRPAPIDGVGPGSIDLNGIHRILGAIRDGKTDAEIMSDERYFEAQIHGPTTASDIARVSFPKKPTKAVQQQLASLGIAWDIYDGG